MLLTSQDRFKGILVVPRPLAEASAPMPTVTPDLAAGVDEAANGGAGAKIKLLARAGVRLGGSCAFCAIETCNPILSLSPSLSPPPLSLPLVFLFCPCVRICSLLIFPLLLVYLPA